MYSKPSSNNRVLSVFSLVMINVIAIDSLRNLPTTAMVGLPIIGFYILGAIFFLLPCVLITAELATHYPKRGGVYVWVREAFGTQWAFLTIWLQWIYNVVWYPTILAFIATNIAYLINPHLADMKHYLIPMIIIMFFAASVANSYGMEISSKLSSFSAIFGTIVPMIILVALGLHWWLAGKPLAITPTWSHCLPQIHSCNNLAILSIVIFSLMGLEMSAVHAQEVKNPERDYPRALIFSAAIITLTMILASLAIMFVVPSKSLSIYSGMDQAFTIFLGSSHVSWLLPVIIIMIIIGSFGGMSAWVIGPTKALMVAAEDGALPTALSKTNKHNVPTRILALQFVIVVALCGLYLAFKQISTAYWILSDITAILALLFYIVFFAAAIKLRYQTKKKKNSYRIPGRANSGIWIAGLVGIITCIIIIILSLLPPVHVETGSTLTYELLLIGGTLLFTLIPLPIYWYMKTKDKELIK